MKTPLRQPDLARALCEHLSDEISVERDDHGYLALLPFTDLYGDSIQIRITEGVDGYRISDDGFAHHELAAITGAVKSESDIWSRVDEVAARFGVVFEDGELSADASTSHELGDAALSLAQAIIESLHLGRLTVPTVGIQFSEEVELFFKDHDFAHVTGERIQGVSGAKHKVDFVFQNGSLHVAQAVASEQSMRRSLNIFYDVTELNKAIQPVAFVDDERSVYSNATFQQLAYKAKVFQWSKRDDFIDYWQDIHRPSRGRKR